MFASSPLTPVRQGFLRRIDVSLGMLSGHLSPASAPAVRRAAEGLDDNCGQLRGALAEALHLAQWLEGRADDILRRVVVRRGEMALNGYFDALFGNLDEAGAATRKHVEQDLNPLRDKVEQIDALAETVACMIPEAEAAVLTTVALGDDLQTLRVLAYLTEVTQAQTAVARAFCERSGQGGGRE